MSSHRRRFLRAAPRPAFLAPLALLASTVPALAQQWDGRISVRSLPGSPTALHVISQPGSYVLTRNLMGERNKHGILVQASDVTIDLNGNQVVGAPGSLNGIHDGGTSLENVAILDGHVTGWSLEAISLGATQYGLVDGVIASASGTGMALGKDFLVHDFSSHDNAGNGIKAQPGSSFLDGAVRANGTFGLTVYLGGGESGTLVADCAFQDNRQILGSHALVTRCDFEKTASTGALGLAELQGPTLIAECRFRAPTFSHSGWGVYGGYGNLVFDNEFHGLKRGIEAKFASWYRENTFVDCETGLQSTGSSLITGNHANACVTDYVFSAGDTYGQVLTLATGYFGDPRPWANFAR